MGWARTDDSTSIASIAYDRNSRELEIEFEDSGDLYRYFGVPGEEFTALTSAPSRGAYFNQVFKPREYPFQLVRRGRKRS
jgi:hypothetical protein